MSNSNMVQNAAKKSIKVAAKKAIHSAFHVATSSFSTSILPLLPYILIGSIILGVGIYIAAIGNDVTNSAKQAIVVILGAQHKQSEDDEDSGGSGAVCSVTGKIDEKAWNKEFSKAGLFAGTQDVFIAVAQQQGIDPVLFAAIAFNETGFGTSSALVTKNNPGGLMGSNGLMVFSSLDEGIEAMGQTLHNRIIQDGLTTIKDLGSVYAPLGAANDPNNLNANWVPNVTDIVKDLGGLTMNCEANGGGEFSDNGKSMDYFDTVMKEALKYKGTAYVFGGSTPSTGFDCSGLVQWSFKKAGISLPRTANAQYNATKRIDKKDAKAGDLVFFKGTYDAGVPITHVGIYTGNGKFYNANDSGVEYSSLSNSYWKSHFAGFGRVTK
ncbi:NlpC/P60 family protein [Heyndrickxia ginsengihumi]|uniref:NlpC/P60 family protein n=1 Tax=Heyndrickxia ginsengihumi TaxID=363870 RepID=UPI00046FE847|nr:NlpC/P60 family protein [Heyndrickxia ginsengihumi]